MKWIRAVGLIATLTGGSALGCGHDDSSIPVKESQRSDAAIGAGGSSCCNPVPASENPAQAVQGTIELQPSSSQKLFAGPAYLTDVEGGLRQLFSSPSGSCTEHDANNGCGGDPTLRLSATFPVHGAHIFVSAGTTVCACNSQTLSTAITTWSGFRPYQ